MSTRFFPHTDYEEDQPLGRTILIYHVLHRGFQSGAIVGLFVGSFQSFRRPAIQRTLLATTLRSTGYGAIVSTGLMVPALIARMWNREEIEWKDRSWRLLENEGQKEVDDWSSVGFVGGALAAARSPAVRVAGRLSLLSLAGGAAVGNLVGVVGYMVWRYGVHGGKWPESQK